MKMITSLSGLAFAWSLLAGPTLLFAGENDRTLTGEGTCARYGTKESPTCQTVITTQENGKLTTFYLAENDVSKKFHSQVCAKPVKVKATGTVKEVNGKQELTASKIELVKN